MSRRAKWSLAVSASVILLFCSSFVFFYTRSQRQLASGVSPNTQSAFGKELPRVHLTSISGLPVDDQILRHGKVVVVFVTPDCNACQAESDFLRTVINRRSDVSFYGIASFGKKLTATEASELFPFKVFYDDGFLMASKLGINRVPIKLYLENGIITKAWGGSTRDENAKADFVKWLDSV
ncbi:MAG: Redoxin [Blastocatellia bacterium]|jgi:thiol-disulfide isomerase/thioredoxin|nr:Redoxin [Blastocatellia bacterium]